MCIAYTYHIITASYTHPSGKHMRKIKVHCYHLCVLSSASSLIPLYYVVIVIQINLTFHLGFQLRLLSLRKEQILSTQRLLATRPTSRTAGTAAPRSWHSALLDFVWWVELSRRYRDLSVPRRGRTHVMRRMPRALHVTTSTSTYIVSISELLTGNTETDVEKLLSFFLFGGRPNSVQTELSSS